LSLRGYNTEAENFNLKEDAKEDAVEKADITEKTDRATIEAPGNAPLTQNERNALNKSDAQNGDTRQARPHTGGDSYAPDSFGAGSFAPDSFDGGSHVIELFASEDAGYPFAADFDIPAGYDADTLVALPVDGENSFIYWDISRATIAALQNRLDTIEPDLAAAVFEIANDDIALLEAFKVETTSGRRYINRRAGMFAPIVAVIGAIKDDEFHDVLISRTVDSPYFRTIRIRPDMWLEKLRDAMDVLKIHPPTAVPDETSKAIALEMGFAVEIAPDGTDSPGGPDKSRVRPAFSSGMIFGGREEK
jgi:hypothetical protein